MKYRLEVAPAGDITSYIDNVSLLWTQLPDISWDRVKIELLPWFRRMAQHGTIVASRFDFPSIMDMELAIGDSIADHTNPGDLVVDPFCGSSTVGLVALRMSRNYYGCDISQIRINESEVRLHGYCHS